MSDFIVPLRSEDRTQHPLIAHALMAVSEMRLPLHVRGTRHIVSRIFCPSLVSSIDSSSFFPTSASSLEKADRVYEKAMQYLQRVHEDLIQ